MYTIVDSDGFPCGSSYDLSFNNIPAGCQIIPDIRPESSNRWDGVKWVEDIDYALSLDKRSKKRYIEDSFNNDMESLVQGYPAKERETWRKQEEEARAYDADISASVPALNALALSSGRDLSELVAKIIEKSDSLAVASLNLTGKRQRLISEVEAASSQSELNLITW